MTTTETDAPLRTLEIKPRREQAIKPAELIAISGHQTLSLHDRRAITILWHNAHFQGIEPGRDYTIEINDLKPDNHKGYEMVEQSIEALMKTLLIIKLPDKRVRRVQFLGGNDLDDPDRPAGVLTYSFDKRMVEMLQDSTIWGKIALPVLMAFSSKYAVSLYENVSQWVGLSRKYSQPFTLAEFRELLGVEEGKYQAFGALNKHVIKPAVMEINALAGFNIKIVPVKEGRRVASIHIGWWKKTAEEQQQAWEEVRRPKVGRKARINGAVEHVTEPYPSQNQLSRNVRTNR